MRLSLRRFISGAVAVAGAVVCLLSPFVAVSPRPGLLVRLAVWGLLVAVVAGALWLRRRDRLAYEHALSDEAAARAVAEDRLAISRDLHDAISGSLGAITVRAAVAQRLEEDSAGLRRALADIEAASRDATRGLRRTLTVLRGEGLPAAGKEPVDGAAVSKTLAQEVERTRAAGLRVELDLRLEAFPVGLGPSVVAVVREGLDNVARHAGPTSARVSVRREGEWVLVGVVDDGAASGWVAQPGAGLGLKGLRERVQELGGYLDATSTGAGFALWARLPVRPVGLAEAAL